MKPEELAVKVVDHMYHHDRFSQWLDIEKVRILPGSAILRMKVRDEMLNGFGLAHGSISYALADSALAFASNSYGKKSLSVDTEISHIAPCRAGDVLTAETSEINRSRQLAHYSIRITNQDHELIAHFKGCVYIKRELWFPENGEE